MNGLIAKIVDDATAHGGAFLWHDGNDFVLLRRLENGAEITFRLPAEMDSALRNFIAPRITTQPPARRG